MRKIKFYKSRDKSNESHIEVDLNKIVLLFLKSPLSKSNNKVCMRFIDFLDIMHPKGYPYPPFLIDEDWVAIVKYSKEAGRVTLAKEIKISGVY